MHFVVRKARNDAPKRIVFPEGEHDSIIRAARDIVDQKIAMPVLLGNEQAIREKARRASASSSSSSRSSTCRTRSTARRTPRRCTSCGSARA